MKQENSMIEFMQITPDFNYYYNDAPEGRITAVKSMYSNGFVLGGTSFTITNNCLMIVTMPYVCVSLVGGLFHADITTMDIKRKNNAQLIKIEKYKVFSIRENQFLTGNREKIFYFMPGNHEVNVVAKYLCKMDMQVDEFIKILIDEGAILFFVDIEFQQMYEGDLAFPIYRLDKVQHMQNANAI